MSTTKEKIEHLLNGGGLKNGAGIKSLDEKGNLVWKTGNISNLIDFREVEIHHEPKWYENIPEQGVLCWVSDVIGNKTNIHLITKYIQMNEFPYVTKNSCYKYATPLMLEEAEQYIMEM
jgi:hypothetical protein